MNYTHYYYTVFSCQVEYLRNPNTSKMLLLTVYVTLYCLF